MYAKFLVVLFCAIFLDSVAPDEGSGCSCDEDAEFHLEQEEAEDSGSDTAADEAPDEANDEANGEAKES